MRNRTRRVIRAGAVAGLLLTALPLSHTPWNQVPHVAAARMAVAGFSPSLLTLAAAQPQRMIFLLRPGEQLGASGVLHTLQQTGAGNIVPLDLIHAVAAQVPAATLKALQFDPALLAMTADRQHQPLPTPDAPAIAAQLAHADLRVVKTVPPGVTPLRQPDMLSIIHADAVQPQYNGRGVRIALVDSGIDLGQADFAGVMLKNAAGKPLYADFTGTDLKDTVGHGTAVASWLVGQGRSVYAVSNTYRASVYPAPNPTTRFNTTTYFTVNGVAPGAKLMVAKIFDTRLPGEGGYDSTIVRAIQWAIANHADVINESFGQSAVVQTNPATDIVALADQAAVRAGITVVVADGNDGPGASSVSSPAQAAGVIAAGASTDYQAFAQSGYLMNYTAWSADNILAFSSLGPTYDGRMRPDLYAPGGWGWSKIPRYPNELTGNPPHQVFLFGGTSAATPAIAGSAALVINAYEATHHGRRPSPAYVKQVLMSTADDLGYPAADQAAGRIDVQRAVDLVTRQGPSVLFSGPLSLHGEQGARLSQTLAVTNTGTTVEQIAFQPQATAITQQLHFSGYTIANNLYTYKFAVPAGISTLSAAVYWNDQLQIPLPNGGKAPVGMIVRLYDPHGNFVNYFGSGTNGAGNVKTTAGRPVPGLWTAVVPHRTIKAKNQVAHYINVPFSAVISLARFTPGPGAVSPASVTLQPGQHARITYTSGRLAGAGTTVVTLRATEHSSSPAPGGAPISQTIPVVITADVALTAGQGTFAGSFHGAQDQGIYEVYYYPFVVPPGTRNAAVALRWKHPNNEILLALLDPEGRARSLDDNALVTGAATTTGPINLLAPVTGGKIDLSQTEVDAFVNHPQPGLWRVEAINYQFAGTQPNVPFTGTILLNTPVAALNHPVLTARAGGPAVPFALHIANPFGALQEYYVYPTTEQYGYLALGGGGGTLQDGPLGQASTQLLTYTTNFVPPGTREVVSQAQALNSTLPVGVSLNDPFPSTFTHYGLPAPSMLGGTLGRGTIAVVSAGNLPVGQWETDLSLPASRQTGAVSVASTTFGYSLIPDPWITTDAQLSQDGFVSTTGLQAGQPHGAVVYHGTVTVPALTAPGTYHAHLFVYSFAGEQWADLPLTIQVQAPAPAPYPTAIPYLADMIANQYFPEGVTGTGVSTQLDLVNPGNQEAHAMIKVLTASGWTSLMLYDLQPHSRRSVNLPSLAGTNQAIGALVQADEPVATGRQITRAGVSGTYSIGTTAPSTHWYFADGYTVSPFQEFITVLNPTDHTAHVQVHVVSDQGEMKNGSFQIGPYGRFTASIAALLPGKAVSAAISSDVAVVAERTEIFGNNGEGVTTTVGATAGLTAGYLDAGHLPTGSQGHLALYNPSKKTAEVTITLLKTGGDPLHTLKVTLKGGRRQTIDLSAHYGTVSLGALLSSTVLVVVEKVAYFGNFKQSQIGGSDVPASGVPAALQVFPGGTTAGGATDFLSLYNPGTSPSSVVISVLYRGNHAYHHPVTVPAGKRVGVLINALPIPAGSSSLIVGTTDGSQIYAQQTLLNAPHTDGSELTGLNLASVGGA
jgi:subtilisin family serine protease